MLSNIHWKGFAFTLHPSHQVTSIGDGCYRSDGDDPQFLLSSQGQPFPHGWCLLRIKGSAERGALTPVFYLDDGDGFSESLKIEFPSVSSAKVGEHFAFLPKGIKAIRFDPWSSAGEFSIDTIEIISVGKYVRAAKLLLPYFGKAARQPRWGLRACRAAVHIVRQNGLAGLKAYVVNRPVVPKTAYLHWIECYDTLTDASRARMRRRIGQWEAPPLISVVMPVFDPPPNLLDEAIRSVRAQIYAHWELCIADDASRNERVRSILRRHAAEDPRVKIVLRPTNGHISAASNSALELASGAFVALLDHDDLLAEHALFWVAESIVDNGEVGLIYSDEDKIDLHGKRHDPYFKCDWNLHLFRSQNMISHLGVYRTALVREVGGFRVGFEGAQDYDLALRCIERLRPDQIRHLPRVLYHWRVIPGSTAMSGSEKPYAVVAGARALTDHLERTGNSGAVESTPYSYYQINYDLPVQVPLVSLVIPTRNGLQLLRKCIESICDKTTHPAYEIIVVDNGSDDPETLAYLAGLACQSDVRVLRDDRPFNYSALNNAAVSIARGEIIGLLNNDIEVISPNWLSEMVSLALQPDVGAVGAKLWYPNDTLQHGGVILGLRGVAGHSFAGTGKGASGYFGRCVLRQSYSAVTAACLLVRKALYHEVGGLNETDLTVAFNDVDFCLKLREKGYVNVWTPYAELYHHESVSRGFEDTPEKQGRFKKEIEYMQNRWKDSLYCDPAYSPNLTLDREDFSLAWPPRVAFV